VRDSTISLFRFEPSARIAAADYIDREFFNVSHAAATGAAHGVRSHADPRATGCEMPTP
jgi:hypothetical protein